MKLSPLALHNLFYNQMPVEIRLNYTLLYAYSTKLGWEFIKFQCKVCPVSSTNYDKLKAHYQKHIK